MGVDYTSHMMFGTTNEVKVPEIVEEAMNEYGDAEGYKWSRIKGDFADCSPEEKEQLKDFEGFYLVRNGYDNSFDGFGIEGKPGKVDEDKVKKLFAKYGYGTPEWVSFVNQW